MGRLLSWIDTPANLKDFLRSAVSDPSQQFFNEDKHIVMQRVMADRLMCASLDKDSWRKARLLGMLCAMGRERGLPEFFFTDRFELDTKWSVIENVPAIDIIVTFEIDRDENLSRQPQPNDLADFAALSVAIPYCDIIVIEKHWANVAKHKGFDKKYQTAILTDIRDIEPILKQKLAPH